jgi:hypothetical protein
VIVALALVASCTRCSHPFIPPDVLNLANEIKVPGQSLAFARAGHSIWVIAATDRRRPQLWRVPPHGNHDARQVQTMPFRVSTQTVMVGDGADLWIAVGHPLPRTAGRDRTS